MADRRITTTIDGDLWHRLGILAAQLQTTKRALLEEALRDVLAKRGEKSMTKLNWQVIEDDGGTLYLVVFDGDRVIYFASGQEVHGTLLDDLAALRGGDDTSDWEQQTADPQAAYDELTSYESGWAVIADQDGVYVDRMGAAGRKALGSVAQYIAHLLDDDGQCWEAADGRDLDTLAKEAGAEVTYHDTRELTRYYFSDGSAIVAGVGGWDIEGDEPFSWAGA